MSLRGAKVFTIVFGIVWVSAWIVVALFLLSSPYLPFYVGLAPLVMGILGVVVFRFAYRSLDPAVQIRRAMDMQREFQQAFFEVAGEQLHQAQSAHHERDDPYIYQVPAKCPECNASISTEEVDWVGPLQARCPYCHSTIEARRRPL